MDYHPPIELDRPVARKQANDRVSIVPVERLIGLSSWMMVLGTIRLVCMLADYVVAFADSVRIEPITMRVLSRMAEEIHPVVAISSAWPLILAIALRRTRWPQLVPAAAATFLVLSLGGIFELWMQWNHARGYGGVVGSFHLTRRAFVSPKAPDFALGTLGAIQLLFEFATAIRAILLLPHLRSAPDDVDTKAVRARRSRYGRMALYTSLGYFFVVIRLPVWSTYLEVLNNSTFVRNFVLRNDNDRLGGRRRNVPYGREPTEGEKRVADLHYMLTDSSEHSRFGRFTDASNGYQRIIAMVDSLPEDSLPKDQRQALVAQALNNLAWQEATCPDLSLRNPREAVKHARRATVIQPEDGNYWNTLGAAHYRAGEWEDAKAALMRSMALRRNADSFDWFFLSLVELKMGKAAEARRWYDQAVEWFSQSSPQNEELYRFQVEAALELGLPKPEAPAVASGPRLVPRSQQPRSIHRLMRGKSSEAGVNKRGSG
jgi:tetratricopeptide (TPR) repeat protein